MFLTSLFGLHISFFCEPPLQPGPAVADVDLDVIVDLSIHSGYNLLLAPFHLDFQLLVIMLDTF